MTLELDERPIMLRSARQTVPRCAVVVVNYGSHELIADNVSALSDDDPDLDIIVVDNFTSEDEAREVAVLGEQRGWTVRLESANLGFGAGVNDGARLAIDRGAEQILLLNPDASIKRRDLTLLQDRVAADPMVMVSPIVKTPEGHVWFGGAVVDLVNGEIRPEAGAQRGPSEKPWLSGACALISADLWQAIGGFDEDYFLYWEDVDLSYRVLLAGGRLEVVHDAAAIHRQGGTQPTLSSRAKSNTYYYHMVRNRLLFAGQHLDRRTRARWLLRSPKYAWDVVLHGGRRQLIHSLAPLVNVARGTAHGVALSRGAAEARAERVGRAAPMVVLQSVPTPKPTTNPYNVLLAEALDARDDVEIRMFGWGEALLHRHDVFHAHWPEALITRRGLIKTRARQALFAVLLLKWKLNRTTIVRTVHNLGLPSDIDVVERFLLNTVEKMTVGRLTLNPFTPTEGYQGPVQVVPHGHYRSWFESYQLPQIVSGRVAFFGAIRRYKGVENLVQAFCTLKRDDLQLVISGRPSTPELAESLVEAAGGDVRITLNFDFLDTAELVQHIGRSELVVLPHTDMHNSGSALAALSLGRPVLMQNNEVNRWLQSEAGGRWVHLYEGEITGDSIVDTIDAIRCRPLVGEPNLADRDWPLAASLHARLYRDSVRVHRERGTRRSCFTSEPESASSGDTGSVMATHGRDTSIMSHTPLAGGPTNVDQ